MLLPSSCLRFGQPKLQNATVGTSQPDQEDRNKELQEWVRQQEEEFRRRYGDEVEIVPSPMLLLEMEEAEGRRSTPVSPDFIPGQIRSSSPPTVSATSASSRRRHHRRKPSSSPSATAVSPQLSKSSAAPAEPPTAVIIGEVRTGAFYSSMEGPSAMVSSQLFSPELVGGHPAPSAGHQLSVRPPVPAWVQTGLNNIKKDLMKSRCCEFVMHLMDHPKDLDFVHSVLQAEFLAEGLLDAPAPVSAGGPFDPLLVVVKAAKLSEPQHAAELSELQHAPKFSELQHAAKLTEPQHAATPSELQHAAKLHESSEGFKDEPPHIQVPEFREGI
ncbi:hypothetical protein CRENBAI_026154 [Crenichthys baileyi]|uniref:Uncharacterized protein n=1 Tax=Crenichthys baileyi TaxID=28760 RepID=A0AAV9RSW1_9TELE